LTAVAFDGRLFVDLDRVSWEDSPLAEEEMRGIREELAGDAGVPDPELDAEPAVSGVLRSVDCELGCGIRKDNVGAIGFVVVALPSGETLTCGSDLPREWDFIPVERLVFCT
jgi:hypothetical protein